MNNAIPQEAKIPSAPSDTKNIGNAIFIPFHIILSMNVNLALRSPTNTFFCTKKIELATVNPINDKM